MKSPEIKHFEYDLQSESFLVEFDDGTKIMGKVEKKIITSLGVVVASFSADIDFEKSSKSIINKELVIVYSTMAKHRIEQSITSEVTKEIKKLK
jgi:hypothetical protein